MMTAKAPFSQGRMDFAWTPEDAVATQEIRAAWQQGKGLLGGDPQQRPNCHAVPDWAANRPFIRALMHNQAHACNRAMFEHRLQAGQEIEIEVGVGRGDFLLARADHHSDRFFVGFEVKTGAVIKLLDRIQSAGLTHVWISDDDVRYGLPHLLATAHAAAVHILFPDPWWKPSHRMRRLFIPPFIEILARHMQPGGLLHVRSDVPALMQWVQFILDQSGCFLPPDRKLEADLEPYQPTHREMWCLARRLPIHTLLCQRRADHRP